MKTQFKITALAAAMTLVMGTAHAASVTDDTSKHNLSADGTTAQYTGGIAGATTQVCVFCHTPHGSSATAEAPIWNKPVNATPGATYARYASTTLDATNLAVGSVSLACLSCHDGTQAMNAVINAPGSGTVAPVSGVNQMVENAASTGIPNLGTNLSNDHPISMQYAGGGCVKSATACTGDADFVAPNYDSINGADIWWVDTDNTRPVTVNAVAVTGSNTKREKTDMILYTRTLTTAQPFVECASCHDPHQTVSRPVQFLRIDNSGSEVCLACHLK